MTARWLARRLVVAVAVVALLVAPSIAVGGAAGGVLAVLALRAREVWTRPVPAVREVVPPAVVVRHVIDITPSGLAQPPRVERMARHGARV